MNVNASPVGAASPVVFDNVDHSSINQNSLADLPAPCAAVAASPTKAVKVVVVSGLRLQNPA